MEKFFTFEQLSEEVLDAQDNSNNSVDGEYNKEEYEFLKSVYEQTDAWLTAISTQFPATTPRFADFQRRLRFLVRLLRYSRYPRLAILGRRGGGKSSLINAILGQMVAQPGHTQAQTGQAKLLRYRLSDGTGLDVLDTRGLNEGGRPIESHDVVSSAVESNVEALTTCPVDAVLLVHKIKEVDAGIDQDIDALLTVLERTSLLATRVPIICVLTHCDELEPSDLKRPIDYDDDKRMAIQRAQQVFLQNITRHAPQIAALIVGVVPVSCALVWLPPDAHDRTLPHPIRDYRYNLDTLIDMLLRNVDVQAVFHTVQVSRATRVKRDFAAFLIKMFASLGALMALTPIPTSDILPLTALITYQTYTIARLSPSALPTNTRIAHFLSVIGLTSILGLGSRYLLTQLLKLSLIPGASAGSAVISYSMVTACGHAAISYFLENKSDEEVRRIFDQFRQQDSRGDVDQLIHGDDDNAGVGGDIDNTGEAKSSSSGNSGTHE